jgi:hypothetical protein
VRTCNCICFGIDIYQQTHECLCKIELMLDCRPPTEGDPSYLDENNSGSTIGTISGGVMCSFYEEVYCEPISKGGPR